jgi:hypothetical protein
VRFTNGNVQRMNLKSAILAICLASVATLTFSADAKGRQDGSLEEAKKLKVLIDAGEANLRLTSGGQTEVWVDVSKFVRDGNVDKVYIESECYSKILENSFDKVQWSLVKKEALRRGIWRIFIQTSKIDYSVIGFRLGLLKKFGDTYRIGCKYEDLVLARDIGESHILSVLGISGSH